MKINELMETNVASCSPGDSLERVAQIMWMEDCGSVPVVDRDSRVLGMITDRDVCMAAYTQGRALREIPVSGTMSKRVWTCRPDDDLATAERTMRSHQIRRVPITDSRGCLLGLLSLADLALEAEREESEKQARKTVRLGDVGRALAAIAKPRSTVAREMTSVG